VTSSQPPLRSALSSRLSLRRWLRRNLGKYVVWDPAELLVPARPEIGRPAEQPVYSERRHIFYLFTTSWKYVLVSLAGLFILARVDNTGGQVIVGLVTFYAQLRLLWDVIEWSIVRIMITDRRLIEFGGFLRRSGGTLPLGKLTDLNFEQSFLGLLFNYGMVRVESAGQDQAQSRIEYLRYPLVFQQELVARAIR
jgi:uncharacterized membrane protein YdbT with pleckstrin-like domain